MQREDAEVGLFAAGDAEACEAAGNEREIFARLAARGARIRAGASLVQIYGALVYQGPGLARRSNMQLARLLQADGFANITEAIGVDG